MGVSSRATIQGQQATRGLTSLARTDRADHPVTETSHLPDREHSTLVPKKRINTAVSPDAGVAPVADALQTSVPLPSGYRCLNPACSSMELIHWADVRGRPKLFCSAACRSAYEYERTELIRDLGVIEEALRRSGGTYRQQRVVESARRQVTWALLRYPYEPSKNRSRGKGGHSSEGATSMSGWHK